MMVSGWPDAAMTAAEDQAAAEFRERTIAKDPRTARFVDIFERAFRVGYAAGVRDLSGFLAKSAGERDG